MKKTKTYILEMEELAKSNGWQEHMEEQERLAREENYGQYDNMVDCKAKEFARKMLED